MNFPYEFAKRPRGHNNQDVIAAIDPGVRTYYSLVDSEGTGKSIGHGYRDTLNDQWDEITLLRNLIIKHSENPRKIAELEAQTARLMMRSEEKRAQNHGRVASYLCRNYQFVLLPKLNFNSKTWHMNVARRKAFLRLAHCECLRRVTQKAHEFEGSTVVIQVCESYTSKVCSSCGALNSPKASEVYECQECHLKVNRDLHGAKNIMLLYAAAVLSAFLPGRS